MNSFDMFGLYKFVIHSVRTEVFINNVILNSLLLYDVLQVESDR